MKKDYKVTIESTVYIGKIMFVDTSEGKKFDYIFSCETKEKAIQLAKKEHTLLINQISVIELNAKYFINTTQYKYGESKGTKIETFDSKKEMNIQYKEYLEWFKYGKRADDKWILEVVCSDGKTRKGKIDC